MKTSELIEQAKIVSMLNRSDGRTVSADIIDLLCNKLEMACKDMKYGIENVGCYVCAKYMPDGWCDLCEFEWRGDAE